VLVGLFSDWNMAGSMASPRRSKTRFLFFAGLCIIVVLACGSILFSKIDQTPFHGDEGGWIYAGYYYTNLVIKGDFDWQRWACDFCGSFGDFNMHLGKWLLGIPLQLEIQKPSALSDFQHWEKALRQKNKILASDVKEPPPGILLSARKSSVFFGILCCVVLLSIGYFCNNIWMGFVSALILSINELFIISSTRAMTDVSYNFFLVSMCLGAFSLLNSRSKKHTYLSALLFGIISGLAASVKIMGVLIGGLLFLSLFIYKCFFSPIKKTAFLSHLMIFGLAALSVIYILNPVFWPSFQKINASEIIKESVAIVTHYRDIYRDTKAITESPSSKNLRAFAEAYGERYPQLFNLSHVFIFPGLFLKWKFEMNQRARTNDTWEGSRFATFHRNLFVTYESFPFEWILVSVGILSMGAKLYFSLRTKEPTPWIIPLLYFVINYLFILGFMKMSWSRYYLPTVIATKMVVGLGVADLVSFVIGHSGLSKKPGRNTRSFAGS
jgi:hypothetical protein